MEEPFAAVKVGGGGNTGSAFRESGMGGKSRAWIVLKGRGERTIPRKQKDGVGYEVGEDNPGK